MKFNHQEFQKSVLKHLKSEGFNCIVQSKPAFPNIIAWRPFVDGNGNTLAVTTQLFVGEKVSYKMFLPFFVSLIECKVNKKISKKEKNAAKKILKEGRCNTFHMVYPNKNKLEFNEITIENNKPVKKTRIEKSTPSYLG